MSWNNHTNNYYDNNLFISQIETTNPCPDQRAISRPLLFVHNYSLFVFGSILNILAFIVLMQGSLRCHSTFAYLAFLSLSNGVLSLVRFTQWMFTYYLKLEFESYLYTCRFYHFTLDFLTHFSLFTLVCVNIDRARTVTKSRPNAKFSRSTFHMVLIKESIIAIILCAYHFHWLIKFGHEVSDGKVSRTICNYDQNRTTPTYFYFLYTIYPPLELIVFFCLPMLINIVCTILILRSLRVKMRTAKRFRPLKQMIIVSNKKTIQTRIREIFSSVLSCFIPRTTTKSNIYSCCCFQIQCRRHSQLRLKIGRTKRSLIKYEEENESTDRQPSSTATDSLPQDIQQIPRIASSILDKNHRMRRTRDIHLSAMLIVLNVLYLIFNLPFNFHQTFGRYIHQNNPNDCIVKFTHVLLDTLQQTYFSTNFFLYILTNRRFREEICSTIRKVFSRKKQYLSTNNNYRRRAHNLSINQSTAVTTNLSEEHPTIPLSIHQNHNSLISDIELIEVSAPQEQTLISLDENNGVISKLVMFKELSN